MKKRSVHFSDSWELELKELVNLMDLSKTYGAEAKALQFSTTFTLAALKKYEMVTPELEGDKMSLFASSISHLRTIRKLRESREKIDLELQKVTPDPTPNPPKQVPDAFKEHISAHDANHGEK